MNKKNLPVDYALLAIVLGMLAFGLASLYSASTVESYNKFGNTTYYIFHQLTNGVLIGLASLVIFSKVDYSFWQKKLPWLVFGSLLLLLMVKVGGFGASAGGAARWIAIGPFSFQPSEIAKLVVIFYIASWVDKKKSELNDFFYGLLPSVIIIFLFAALILWQPDMGTMLILLSVSAAMLFAAGIKWRYVLWSIGAGLPILALLVKFESYRLNRIMAFLNPQADPQGIGYHISQALLAVGAGQIWGYGYGLSRQKYNYLPEVMGDSIFAILAEELGFIRASVVIILFVVFAIKGYSIAKNAPDLFGRLTAFGITTWITLQAFINIGAMLKVIPLTGVPLPFFSYGSSALIMNLAAAGILLNISRKTATVKKTIHYGQK